MTSGQAARTICCGAMLADPSRPLREKGRNNKTPGRRQLCCQRAKIPRSRSTLSQTGSCPMSASMFIPSGHGDGTRASTRSNGMPSATEIVRSSSRSAGVTPRARRPRTVISRSTACSHCPTDAELATCRNVPAGRRSQYRPDRLTYQSGQLSALLRCRRRTMDLIAQTSGHLIANKAKKPKCRPPKSHRLPLFGHVPQCVSDRLRRVSYNSVSARSSAGQSRDRVPPSRP